MLNNVNIKLNIWSNTLRVCVLVFTRKWETIQLPRIHSFLFNRNWVSFNQTTLCITFSISISRNESTCAPIFYMSNTFYSYEFLLSFYIKQKWNKSRAFSIGYEFRRPSKSDKYPNKKREKIMTENVCIAWTLSSRLHAVAFLRYKFGFT